MHDMATAITTDTSINTGQTSSRRTATQPTNTPVTQTTPNAAQRLRTTFVPVRLAFTWLGVRKTLAPEQCTTAARAVHTDRELLSASKLILDTKSPAYRAVAVDLSWEPSGTGRRGGGLKGPAALLPPVSERLVDAKREE